MCPEPQCLVPIIATKAEQVVLIGDHKQLRPIIMCREAGQLGLETSLFERYATSSSSCNVQFIMLNEQYRMVIKLHGCASFVLSSCDNGLYDKIEHIDRSDNFLL